MAEDHPKYPVDLEAPRGFAIGDNNIIHNYFGYPEEVINPTVDADDNLPCPYRGLYHFSPNDAEYFFGRDLFINKLFEETQISNFIPVLGASGSGKSSVVLAGLIPKLEQEQKGHWKFTHFRPGSDPFHALALALVPLYTTNLDDTEQIAQTRKLAGYLNDNTVPLSDVFAKIQQNHFNHRILLIADQFEEIYTQCSDHKVRNRFLDCLLASFQSSNSSSSSSTVLVTTMRADFLANALSYRPFADMLQNTDIKLSAMSREELKEVIEKPAENIGFTFAEGLVERILNDVEGEPGNLPLLEFALTELWKKRAGKQLTHEAYKKIGEIKGALVNYADSKYAVLTNDEKQLARRIFLQLIHFGDETEDTRDTRRVVTKEGTVAENWLLIQKLADARLVVTNRKETGQEMVEIVHEALIQHWQQLRQWLEESRASLLENKKIEAAAAEWNSDLRNPSYLFQGIRLKKARYFHEEQEQEFSLSKVAKEFIQAGIRQQIMNNIKTLGNILIIPLLGIGMGWVIWKQIVDQQLESRLSLGENIFFNTHVNKRSGADFFANGKFDKATDKFNKSLKNIPDDPEALIYFNNANAMVAKKKPLSIAVSVPISSVPNVAQEMLRGVAQAQDEVNKSGGIHGRSLQVEIGNDDNDPETAKSIAGKLVEDSKILAVVGHNSNDASKKGAEVYQDHLVMISPTSFALDFQEIKKPQAENYIFRNVYSYQVILPALADHIEKTLNNPKLLICYDSKAYNREWFAYGFSENKKIKLADTNCDFSNPNLDLNQVIEQGIKKGANSLFLAPHVNRINESINLVKANKGRLKLFGSATLYTIDTLKLGQKDVEGLVLSVYWHPSAFPKHPFYKEAKKLWKEDVGVTWRTAMAYDATKVIIKGLKEIPTSQTSTRTSQTSTRKKLQKIISNPKFEIQGATGNVQFLQPGDRRGGQAFLVEVCPGKESGTGYDFVPLGTCQKQ